MDMFNFGSSVLSKNACVVTDQPLASKIGYDILQKGGNAVDAAIAMSVAGGFLSPHLCGLGGDCNILFYRASDRSVSAINGSGRSPQNLSLSKVQEAGFDLRSFETQADLDSIIIPSNHGIFINVPGFVMGIYDLHKKFGSGKLTMKDLLSPTIEIAQEGAPIPVKTALKMQAAFDHIKDSKNLSDIFGSDGPVAGRLIRSPKLAQSLKMLADEGPKAFYCGKMAENIVKAAQDAGGLLTMDDMMYHFDSAQLAGPTTPHFKDFHGFRIWEMPPNAQGIVVLCALELLDGIDLIKFGHNSAEYIHTVAKALSTAFILCWKFLYDLEHIPDDSYIELFTGKGRKEVLEQHELLQGEIGKLVGPQSGDTSYVTAVDEEGNACSLIFSIFSRFGSGNIPDNCGFLLHDRGKLFSFDESSPNVFGPKKRSLHTIIPAIVTDATSGDLIASFGVIGKYMQPQGHVQVFLNMVIFGMDPQTALQQPRFCIGNPHLKTGFRDSLNIVNLEEGISSSVAQELKDFGHQVPPVYTDIERGIFGSGYVIAKPRLWSKDVEEQSRDVLWAGVDSRSDGIPIGY